MGPGARLEAAARRKIWSTATGSVVENLLADSFLPIFVGAVARDRGYSSWCAYCWLGGPPRIENFYRGLELAAVNLGVGCRTF